MNHSGDANKMVGEDHIPDIGKMVSDTPRTADRVVFIDGNPWVNAPFARGLERELNASNQRIKQLEAVVNDPEVLWSNWLRGTVKLPSGIGDVRQYQARIKRLEDAGDALYELCDPSPIQFDLVDQIPQRLKAWEEAKEDEP